MVDEQLDLSSSGAALGSLVEGQSDHLAALLTDAAVIKKGICVVTLLLICDPKPPL